MGGFGHVHEGREVVVEHLTRIFGEARVFDHPRGGNGQLVLDFGSQLLGFGNWVGEQVLARSTQARAGMMSIMLVAAAIGR